MDLGSPADTGGAAPPPEPVDPLPTARGLLAIALERCDPGSDAALEICAAWESLDDAGEPSWLDEPVVPNVFGADVVVVMAKRVLRSAILAPGPIAFALPVAMAIRHLQVASRILAEGATCGGSSWD